MVKFLWDKIQTLEVEFFLFFTEGVLVSSILNLFFFLE